MYDEIELSFESTWDKVEEIFKDPMISKFFESGLKKTNTLLRSLIIEYRKGLMNNPNFSVDESIIPTDDEMIISRFKETLKGQILTVALGEVLTEKKLDVRKNILELTEPVNLIQLFSKSLDITFEDLMKEEMIDDIVSGSVNQYWS